MGIKFKIIIFTIIATVFIGLGLLYSPCFAMTVQLQWDPNTESDLAGYKIYYKSDSSSLPFNGSGATEGAAPIDVHNQTSGTISGLDPAHSYFFAITAYNSSGIESSLSNIFAIPESLPPSVSLTYPSNNSNVSGTVSVTASATDNVGVTKVELYLNDVLLASETTAPYLYSWNTTSVTPGVYTLYAKAYDAAGNVGQSSSLTVTVVKDVSAPTVSMTAPANNAILNGTITVSATATDNIGISRVEFYQNGVLTTAMNTVPYNFSWNTATATNGSYILTAKAYDASGNVGQSGNVLVTVSNVFVAPAPAVADSTPLSIIDAMLALNIAVGKVNPTSAQITRLDVAPVINGISVPNGRIDTGDAIVILSKLVGKIAF